MGILSFFRKLLNRKAKYTMVAKDQKKPGTIKTIKLVPRSRMCYTTPGVPNRKSIRESMRRTGRSRTLRFKQRKYRRLMSRGETLVFRQIPPKYGRRSGQRPLDVS